MYKYYQPNEKDLKDDYGNCVIRALCKALNKNWRETFILCCDYALEVQCPINCLPLKLSKDFFNKLGFTYNGISNKKGSKRPTVESFAKEHKKGIYVLSVANHFVTVVDGVYYDTWDCGYKSLYGYYEKVREYNE